MNADQAKRIDLRDLLSRLGYEPSKVTHGGSQLFYKAPWRTESVGSVHATRKADGVWIWNDQGEGAEGGSVIDLMIRLRGGDAKAALHALSSMYQGALFDQQQTVKPPAFSFHRERDQENPPPLSVDTSQSPLKLVRVLPLTSVTVLSYLQDRCIPSGLAQRYLKLVQYRNTDRPHDAVRYGFGQQNRLGGYEVRSALDSVRGKFKTAINGRDIAVHPGTARDGRAVSVFEGMLDHLSLLVALKASQLRGDAVVMNALSSYDRTVAFIKQTGYTQIDLFLDNDDAGRRATATFIDLFGEAVNDRCHSYAPHKDINDALRAGHDFAFAKGA